MKTLSILGSTGSVGCATLDVVREVNNNSRNSNGADIYSIIALTAYKNSEKLIEQALEFRPKVVAIVDKAQGEAVKSALANKGIEVLIGENAISEAAQFESDMLMAAIVGSAGLAPTLKAVERSATILLANKECLVSAGPIFVSKAKQSGSRILPVDSEHNAIFQVLNNKQNVEKLVLTASGGPFLNHELDELHNVTPIDACRHPNWDMGRKISVDCATMMNKGLELIEAALLFDMPEDRIDVLIHPQSIIHSMVSYADGSVLAQLGTPDMRIPISYCLAWPDRHTISTTRLDLAQIARLDFFKPDNNRFPALNLARFAMAQSKNVPTILNAANEFAVNTFLSGNVTFTQIAIIVEETLNEAQRRGYFAQMNSLDDVELSDNIGRKIAAEIAHRRAA